MGNIELYRKIVELEGEVTELARKSRGLEDENDNLKRSFELRGGWRSHSPMSDFGYPTLPGLWEGSEFRPFFRLRF